MERKVFGKTIKELRIAAGFSQRYVAEKAGISYTYLSKIEKGVIIPSRNVIIQFADIFAVDKDELLTLAGKLPFDITKKLNNNPKILRSLRNGRINKQNNKLNIAGGNFGEQLKKLREKAGLSQGELAEKIGVSFTYLSKIENGAKPAPSQKIIYKLASVLNIDVDELLAISGKVPSEVIDQLQNHELLNALRSSFSETYQTRRARCMGFIKNILNVGRLSRVAVPVMLVVAVAASLVFSAPLPVKAVDFEFTPANPTATSGSAMTFTVKVKVQNTDKLPVQGVKVLFSDKPYGHTTYYNEFRDLPLNASSAVTKNSVSGPTNTISVSSTTSTEWGYLTSTTGRQGYGYGYDGSTWSWTTKALNNGYGYGYGYNGVYVGDAWIQYTITWTPPSNWPAGTYYITSFVLGNGDGSYVFAEDTSFALSAAVAPAPAPVIVTTPTPTPAETEPGTWDTENVVDDEGTFTTQTTVTSDDDELTVTIGEGVKGTTNTGETVKTVKVTKVAPETLPEPPATITGKKNVLVMTYNIDVNNGQHVTFDQPVTLTFDYDPALLPADVAEEDLVVAWYDEVNGKWVELPTTVDPVTKKLTVQVNHFSKWAVIARVTEEVEPVLIDQPVIEEEETVVEEETAVVEEEETVVEEETAVVEETEEPVVTTTETEEESTGGISWWVWLIIGIAVVAVIVLAYIYWWKPRMA